jgi:hypothetical protein
MSAAPCYADLPASAVESARGDIHDTFGCVLGGSGSPGIGELFAVVSRWGGQAESRVLLRHMIMGQGAVPIIRKASSRGPAASAAALLSRTKTAPAPASRSCSDYVGRRVPPSITGRADWSPLRRKTDSNHRSLSG